MAVTLTIPEGTFQLNGNPIYIDVQTTTTGKTLHKLYLKITCTNGVVSNGPWTDFAPIDENGKARFDIQALMNIDANYDFSTEIQIPEKLIEHDQIAANITVECSEKYIENGIPVENSGNSDTLVILKGGVSNLGVAIKPFVDYVDGEEFLTKMPYNTIIPFDCWPKLWLTPPSSQLVELWYDAYYADGYKTEAYSDENLTLGKMYEISTDPLAWGLEKYHAGAQLVKIHLVSNTNSQALFNDITFHIAERHFNTITEFYFVNQFGAVDLAVCTGEFNEITETKGEFSVKALGKDPSLKDPTKISHRKTIATKFKVETGAIPVEQRRWLVDLFSSEQVWWKTDRFGVPTGDDFGLIPVRILPGTFNLNDSEEDLISIPFEFEIAHVEQYIN